ncbi:hypothetical protein EV421DRAFT_1744359 [Armillaria borealis]|uniref:Uncharacterized protein n=1 Tax=Armillaria borealis TaxID=47425 RepID=A0AA39MCX6_9AGAR|nr:hypothetical protein EV421DRAFT_1744359 [Armillaria borealis]
MAYSSAIKMLSKKRVAFKEPANDTNIKPKGQKKRKSHGAKKQKDTLVPNTQNVTETSNNSNAPQIVQDNVGHMQTARPRPSKNVKGHLRPYPAYKQAMTAGQNVMTRQIGTVSGSSTLQVLGPSVLQDGEIDTFYSSLYKFQDLSGSGYLEVNSDDEHLTQIEPVLNYVVWRNVAYANIGWYSGHSASDIIFSQQWNHHT